MDDFNSFFGVYPLHYKNEVFTKFLDFKSYAENQFHTSLKILCTDGGSEFVNKKLDLLHLMESFISRVASILGLKMVWLRGSTDTFLKKLLFLFISQICLFLFGLMLSLL